MNSMTRLNTMKIHTKEFSINIQRNKKSIEIDNHELPAFLFKETIVRTPDKERIE